MIGRSANALGIPFINIIFLNLRNSSRNSRNLVKVFGKIFSSHSPIDMFDRLQSDAERIEEDISRAIDPTISEPELHLSSWIYHHKLRMLESIFSRGFELGVYEPYEMPMIHYYLIHIHDMQIRHWGMTKSDMRKGIPCCFHYTYRWRTLCNSQT